MREHSLNNEVEIISVGVARLGGMYEDIHKLLPQAKITRFTHISRASDLTDKELETMLRYRSLPPSMHAKLTKAWMLTKKKLKRSLISQMQNLQRCFRERPHGAKHQR